MRCRTRPIPFRRLRATLRKMHRGNRGVSSLEWVLLLAAIGIPLFLLTFKGIEIIAAHYQMQATMNAMPWP